MSRAPASHPLLAILRRDLSLLLRGGRQGGVVLPVLFFLSVAMLFPFAVGPDPRLLARAGGGVIWVAALLAAILPLDRLIEPDMALGCFDQWALRGIAEEAVVMALSLIDLSLTANLILIVTFTGYEIFVSKIDMADHPDRPDWLGKLDFSGLKLKLIASIVAISAVALLRAFMALAEKGEEPDGAKLGWMVGLHLTFVVSGVMMALMDWLVHKTES